MADVLQTAERTTVYTSSQLLGFINFNIHPNLSSAIDFFWALYKPRARSMPPLFIDRLIEFATSAEFLLRPEYEPDTVSDRYRSAVYAHVASALAVLLRDRDQVWGEPAQTALLDALRLGYDPWIRAERLGGSLDVIARQALGGAIHLAMFEIERYSDPGKAFGFLTEGLLQAAFAFETAVDQRFEDSWADYSLSALRGEVDSSSVISETTDEIDFSTLKFVPLADLKAQDLVDAFESTLSSPSTDWPAIAPKLRLFSRVFVANEDCEMFVRPESESPIVRDSQGLEWVWPAYWARALILAEQRLTPDVYASLLRQREDEQAEARLERYFFQGSWQSLPDRARTSLIEADRRFVSGSAGRGEATINDLRIAVEEILFHLVWKPMEEWDDDSHDIPGDFHAKRQDLQRAARRPDPSPNLRHIAETFTTASFQVWLQGSAISHADRRFLADISPKLWTLWRTRSGSEHQHGSVVRPDDVREIYSLWLGLGCEPLLPRLAQIAKGSD